MCSPLSVRYGAVGMISILLLLLLLLWDPLKRGVLTLVDEIGHYRNDRYDDDYDDDDDDDDMMMR